MSNLGSDNTPVKGENFTLPDGAQIDQDGGDLVVRDTDGTVALRRTDGAGWSLEGNDLNSVGTALVSALEAESLNGADIEAADDGELLQKSADGTNLKFAEADGFDLMEMGDFTSNRSVGVEYENNTGNYLIVYINIVTEDESDRDLYIYVNGETFAGFENPAVTRKAPISTTVFLLPGDTIEVSGERAQIRGWFEQGVEA